MTDAELYAMIQSDTQAAALYAEGNDEGCAVRCSAIAPPIRQPVDARRVQEIATLNGLWGVLVIAAQDPNLTNPPRGVAVNFVTWIEKGFSLNPDSVPVQQMAAALMAYNLATAEQVQQLSDAANTPQTITQQQVGAAREWNRVNGGVSNGTT